MSSLENEFTVPAGNYTLKNNLDAAYDAKRAESNYF